MFAVRRENHQVFDPVVCAVAVRVMDNLCLQKFATEVTFHQQAMFWNVEGPAPRIQFAVRNIRIPLAKAFLPSVPGRVVLPEQGDLRKIRHLLANVLRHKTANLLYGKSETSGNRSRENSRKIHLSYERFFVERDSLFWGRKFLNLKNGLDDVTRNTEQCSDLFRAPSLRSKRYYFVKPTFHELTLRGGLWTFTAFLCHILPLREMFWL